MCTRTHVFFTERRPRRDTVHPHRTDSQRIDCRHAPPEAPTSRGASHTRPKARRSRGWSFGEWRRVGEAHGGGLGSGSPGRRGRGASEVGHGEQPRRPVPRSGSAYRPIRRSGRGGTETLLGTGESPGPTVLIEGGGGRWVSESLSSIPVMGHSWNRRS